MNEYILLFIPCEYKFTDVMGWFSTKWKSYFCFRYSVFNKANFKINCNWNQIESNIKYSVPSF